MKKIFVTGADGLLGSNLVRELVARGYSVRGFVQRDRSTQTLSGLNIEVCFGDLLDPASVMQAVAGCDAVIHAAALTTVWPSRSQIVRAVNIEGTRHVLDAARVHHVSRMVYISSASAFGFGTKADPGTESNEYISHKYGLDYIDSKREAQMMVLAAAREGMPCVVVNPTFMFGAYDSGQGPAAMILALAQGKLPGHTLGGRNFICVRDAATAIANALTMGSVGECYLLGNENLSYAEIFARIAAVTGAKAPGIAMPSSLMCAFGWCSQIVAGLSGRKPTVSYPMARISCDGQYYSSAKARNELCLPQTPIEVGITEAFEWLKLNGRIQKTATASSFISLSSIRSRVEGLANVIAKRPIL
jgi:dihydroflavonol-4-reductase